MSPSPVAGPPLRETWKLVTVNTAPEREKLLIGRVIENVKEQFTMIHAANVDGTLVNLATWSVIDVPFAKK
jgi:hypothetical protein